MEGKNKKECEVVMLSTPKAVFPNCIWLGRISKTLHLDQSYAKGEVDPIDDSMLPQHIYITSDNEIKEEDWCVFNYNYTEKSGVAQYKYITDKSKCKKIIATTDSTLQGARWKSGKYEPETPFQPIDPGLPQPSPEFIRAYVKAYNEGNIITKVMVDYVLPKIVYRIDGCPFELQKNGLYQAFDEHGCETLKLEYVDKSCFIPKIDSHNQITITRVKDSWTRGEVIELIKKFTRETISNYSIWCENDDKWIEKNL